MTLAAHPSPNVQATMRSGGLLDLVANRPWALPREKVEALRDLVVSGQAVDLANLRALRSEAQAKGGPGAQGPVAIIPVAGVIDQHESWLSLIFGDTTIDGLRAQLRAAMDDPAVKSIVLAFDSPGGSVYGVSELAGEIRAMRGGSKPIVSVCDPMAASAAYWLAAQADEVVVTPSGRVGSVGVYTIHQEISRLLDAMGVTTTIISAGEHKVEGNEFQPLTDAGRADAQKDVDTFYGMFVADVAKGRRVSQDVVNSTYGQGRAPLAREALAAGMVDRIDTLGNTVARLAGAGAQRGRMRASAWQSAFAMAVPVHSTPTDDGSWDGAANESRLPTPMPIGTARNAYGWLDEDEVIDASDITKDDCKFIHHDVAEDGTPGAANLTACSSGIAVLNGGRGGTDIPDEDRQGVYDHLAHHLRDADREPPPLQGSASYSDRVDALATEATALVEWATERARLRAKEDRPAFNTRTEAALRVTRAALDVLLGPDDPDPSEPSPAPAVEPPGRAAAPVDPAPAARAAKPANRPRFTSSQAWLDYLRAANAAERTAG